MIEMGVGDQGQVALDVGEEPGEPVTSGYIAVRVGQHPKPGLSLPAKGAVAVVGQCQGTDLSGIRWWGQGNLESA